MEPNVRSHPYNPHLFISRNFGAELSQSAGSLVPDMLSLLRRNNITDGEKLIMGLVDDLTSMSFCQQPKSI